MRLLLALLGALAGGARAEMLHLNCTGLGFEAALQATVAQGLLNREAPRVWISDIAATPSATSCNVKRASFSLMH